jgi:hypothetical protein
VKGGCSPQNIRENLEVSFRPIARNFAQFQRRPDAKFDNGENTPSGTTAFEKMTELLFIRFCLSVFINACCH